MNIRRRFKVPLYDRWVNLLIRENIEDVAKKYDLGDGLGDYHAITFKHKGEYYMAFNKSALYPGNIVHECKHLVNHIFIDLGAQLDRYNDEMECYLLGYLVEKVHKLIENEK